MTRASHDRLAGYVDDLLRGRRARRLEASSEELDAVRAAASLVAARTGADLPDRQSLDRIRARLQKVLPGPDARPRAAASMSRRGLLRTGGLAAAAMIVGAVGERVLTDTAASETVIPMSGRWTPVAAVSQVPPGAAIEFGTGAMRGVLLNDGGRISAVSGVCTHLGCLLRPNPSDRSLDCPCHRTSFDWSGRVVRSEVVERPPALPHFESRVRDGQIEVFVV